jgi:hypothetical protein
MHGFGVARGRPVVVRGKNQGLGNGIQRVFQGQQGRGVNAIIVSHQNQFGEFFGHRVYPVIQFHVNRSSQSSGT